MPPAPFPEPPAASKRAAARGPLAPPPAEAACRTLSLRSHRGRRRLRRRLGNTLHGCATGLLQQPMEGLRTCFWTAPSAQRCATGPSLRSSSSPWKAPPGGRFDVLAGTSAVGRIPGLGFSMELDTKGAKCGEAGAAFEVWAKPTAAAAPARRCRHGGGVTEVPATDVPALRTCPSRGQAAADAADPRRCARRPAAGNAPSPPPQGIAVEPPVMRPSPPRSGRERGHAVRHALRRHHCGRR